ncbi:hypothetical protein CHH59_08815 [Shouchella clausii]|nr:hypothetical protein CHH59_08815 [Shouchella clausii]
MNSNRVVLALHLLIGMLFVPILTVIFDVHWTSENQIEKALLYNDVPNSLPDTGCLFVWKRHTHSFLHLTTLLF